MNADCQVSVADVQAIAVEWGEPWSLPYDVDQDGSEVDAGDIQTAAANWPASLPGPCNQAITKYYRLGGRLVALRKNGQLRYVHTDHLGSLSLLTDENGHAVPGSLQRFYPFGKTRTGQPVILPTEQNFTGQQFDANTGLLYYSDATGYGRYYDPALGRWTQPDTMVPNLVNPQDLNRYSYVRNNPVRHIDPTGHCIPGVDCPGDRYRDEPYIAPPSLPPVPWWQNVTPPSIWEIRPGGRYGAGEIPYGDRMISVYLPPTVWWFPGNPGYHPLYDPAEQRYYYVPAGSYIADYWFGEYDPAENIVIPDQWHTIDISQRMELPSPSEALAGAAMAVAEAPESLPPDSGTTRAELKGELMAHVLYALSGAMGAARENRFILQEDRHGNYRLILLTRQLSGSQYMYVTAQGFVPVIWGPYTIRAYGR